jgi:SAM-dependent methyltransferase
VEAGIPVLGIDPARNVVETARDRGVETLCEFFSADLAEELRASGRRASVLHANNVLAHVPDVNGVVTGIGRVLADDGVAVIETPYVRDLIERLEFDTIYHEHLFYYSLTALQRLCDRNGVRIVDVERIPIHGGSLRVFTARAATAPEPAPAVAALLEEEASLGLATLVYFQGFGDMVEALKGQLLALLDSLKGRGDRIAAYGAAAKGTVLLNAFGIGTERIEFVADRSDHKQGRFMPGVHIPIVGPEKLLEEMPDEVLLLAWNFADEILEQQAGYRARGGRFIIPAPVPEVVE